MAKQIAHEIKNPLGIIQGSAQVVANADRPMEMRMKAADFIVHEVERLNHTLTTFLDFAKPASPNFQQIDMTSLLEEILISTQERFTEQGYVIDCDFPATAPWVLRPTTPPYP